MTEEGVREITLLVRERNVIDEKIAGVIKRLMTAGHLGEWIAAQVFDIDLETPAVTAAIDGRFKHGPLRGRTVKSYVKGKGLVDITESSALDCYLVLAGPTSASSPAQAELLNPFALT